MNQGKADYVNGLIRGELGPKRSYYTRVDKIKRFVFGTDETAEDTHVINVGVEGDITHELLEFFSAVCTVHKLQHYIRIHPTNPKLLNVMIFSLNVWKMGSRPVEY